MTCHLLRNPDAVFIHIPKCAGTSVQALWEGRIANRAFGHIPPEWRDKPSFAVIRDPQARFLSALRMFKFGAPDHPGHYSQPVWPELTIGLALDILDDEKIPFDRAMRYLEANLKHHIVAQTHPYNCLRLADTILRQETLAADFDTLRTKFGFKGALPQLRQTPETGAGLVPTEAERNRIHAAFQEDYQQLGYEPGSTNRGSIALTPRSDPTLWDLWPGFFCDRNIPVEESATALPDDRVDLDIFARDTIRGKRGGTWPGRSENVNQHFHQLLPEFVGRSRLAHLLACCIVAIRKTKGRGPGLALFHRIIAEHTDQICSELNSRWLASVCDTLADHGQTGSQRALGLCGSLLASTVKLSETERRIFHPARPWPPKARLNDGGPLFDGVIGFWLEKGDMVKNLLQRIESVQKDDPIAGQFVLQLMYRLIQHDTVFRRITDLAGTKLPPLVEDSVKARLERIAKNRL